MNVITNSFVVISRGPFDQFVDLSAVEPHAPAAWTDVDFHVLPV